RVRAAGRPRRDGNRKPAAVKGPQHLAQPRHGATAVAPRGVTARPALRDPQTAGPLLGHHDRVELAAPDVLGAGAAFTNAVANALEELGVLLDQVLGAQGTACLLVGQAA